MTLVLPVPSCGGGGVRALVSPSNNDLVNNNSSNNHRNKLAMPCGFDGEPLDFESALMLQGDFGPDWSTLKTPWSNGNVSEITANPFPSSNVDGAKCSVTTASILRNQVSLDSPVDPVSAESSSDSDLAAQDDTLMEQCQEQCNKRKIFSEPEELTDQTRLDDGVEEIPRKRCRTNSIDILDEPTSRDVSVTSLADDLPLLTNTSPPLPLPSPPKDVDPISPGSCAEEEDLFTPRRRVPMLWSPRLRLKDERRRVLKMSLSKLRKIEDPELFLRRSVLVNNTMKRLQREIRDERFAKYHQSSIQESNNHSPHHHNRHPIHHSPLSYGMDVQMSNGLGDSSMMCKEVTQNHCNNPMMSSSHYVNNLKQSCWGFDNQPPEDGFPNKKMVTSSGSSCGGGRQTPVPAANCEESNPDSSGSSSDEGSSCDEMFGINEDFLRIHIPKSPPTPVTFDNHDQQSDCVASVQPSLTSSTTHHQCHQQQQHDQNLTSNKIEQHTVNQLDRVRVGHVHLSSIERPLNGCDSSREDDSRMLSLDNIHQHHHHHDNHDHHQETDNENRKNASRDDSDDLSRTTLESLSNCGNRYIYDHQNLGSNHHHASSGQCSAQYRTLHHLHHGQQRNNNQDNFGHCGNENSYSTPAMPILDSVVYHSLLASLDT